MSAVLASILALAPAAASPEPPPPALRPEIAALVLEPPVPTYSRPRRIASQVLLWSGAATMLITAIGHSATSVPAVHGHFAAGEPDVYWRNRLLASQILGATAQYLTAATQIAGAAMHRSRSPGMHRAGRVLLLMSIGANLVSAIAVPVLTPSDWEHGMAHIAAIGLTAGGLAVAW